MEQPSDSPASHQENDQQVQVTDLHHPGATEIHAEPAEASDIAQPWPAGDRGHQRAVRRLLARALHRRGRSFYRSAILAVAAEHQFAGSGFGDQAPGPGETAILLHGAQEAQECINRGGSQLDALADKQHNLVLVQAALLTAAHRTESKLVANPAGGYSSVKEAQAAHANLQEQERIATESKDLRHARLRPALRQIPKLVFVCDAIVLLWFIASVFNVDWQNPFSLALVFASVFTIFATGVSYLLLTLTGLRLRGDKTKHREIPWVSLDPTTRLMLAAAALLATVLAILMYVRVYQEVHSALGSFTIATVFAMVFAVISTIGNLTIACIHAFDGSDLTERIDALGRVINRPTAKADRLRKKAGSLNDKIVQFAEDAEGIYLQTLINAYKPLRATNEAILAGYAGSGRILQSSRPTLFSAGSDHPSINGTPVLDRRLLDKKLAHMQKLAAAAGRNPEEG